MTIPCAVLQHLYPELGVDITERAYGGDCRLYIEGQGINWPVIKATLFDEFVVAHTVGWWCKVYTPEFMKHRCSQLIFLSGQGMEGVCRYLQVI